MADIKKGRKQVGPAHCRGCGQEISRDKAQHVKIGKRKYHGDCAEKKDKARQRWDVEVGWVRL